MSILQEQAVRMIGALSDDNVSFLIDMMQRFMLPKDEAMKSTQAINIADDTGFMQEMEKMRMKAQKYFPVNFDPEKIWEEAMDGKYGCID